MTITIKEKTYKITRDAEIEYRSDRVDPFSWVALYLEDESVTDEFEDHPQFIAWYYVEDLENAELDEIDYENPYDIVEV